MYVLAACSIPFSMNSTVQKRSATRRKRVQRQIESRQRDTKHVQAISLELINSHSAGLIHDAVKRILWNVGVIIEHPSTRRMLIKNHKCVENDAYIRLPPDLIEQAISTAPDKILLYDRNGEVRVDTSDKVSSFCPGHNCVRILDFRTGELRPCSLEDIRETARLCDHLPNIDMVCSLGYPSEVDPEDEVVETTKAMYDNCNKPAALLAHDDKIQKRMMDVIADRAGGWNEIAEKPVSIELMGPISPLRLPEDLCERLINCARWRAPVVCYPATFPGMSCPISVAGAIAQSSAEAIAGIVIHQLNEPGAPVLSGSAVLPMDLRQANLAYGSPEYMLSGLGASDYFRYIGIPSWIGAGCSDSHQFDAQAAAEAAANLTIASMAKSSFVHNLGFLSGGRTGSLEMLMFCDEMIGWTSKMAGGVQVNAESLAVEVVERSALNTEYLTDQHTQDRYLTENWYPNLCERSDAEAWLEEGGDDMQARIRQRLSEILG